MQEEKTEEHLALWQSKSDNRMMKLSADGMLSQWVRSFSFTYLLLHRDNPKETYI